MGEVFDLLGKPVGESCVTAHAYPHGEVLTFYTYQVEIFDWSGSPQMTRFIDTRADCGAVRAFVA